MKEEYFLFLNDRKYVIDRLSLFRGHLCNISSKWDLKILVVIESGN